MSDGMLERDVEQLLARAGNVWEEFRGASIFITGGTGFFGHWLLETFAGANARFDLNARAVVLSRDPKKFLERNPGLASNPAIAFHLGDVRRFDYPEGSFSHIIHAATPASAALNDQHPLEMLEIIAGGTRRVLDFAQHSHARKLLLCSSGAVYGRQPPDMPHIAESYMGAPDPLDPRSAYGEGKRIAELMCTTVSHQTGIEMKIARCFAFLGPHLPLDAHFAAGNFLGDALAARPIVIHGDGTPVRSYLYAADLMVWLWTILARGEAGRAYNAGSEAAIDIAHLAQRIVEIVAPATPIEIRTRPIPGRTPERYVPSTLRARSELQLDEYTDLSEAIRRTAAWHRLRRSP
ncbi:MAG TPA: NAD-dependent epimerase/dehydratase family protein [Bryobacteraceae bacterium]|nr:NAD-dependent epimerase/dehydratase family protein [Bryobacteraceae bacterium]